MKMAKEKLKQFLFSSFRSFGIISRNKLIGWRSLFIHSAFSICYYFSLLLLLFRVNHKNMLLVFTLFCLSATSLHSQIVYFCGWTLNEYVRWSARRFICPCTYLHTIRNHNLPLILIAFDIHTCVASFWRNQGTAWLFHWYSSNSSCLVHLAIIASIFASSDVP